MLVCLLTLLCLVIVPQAPPRPTAARIEADLVRLLNRERASQGLSVLKLDERLAQAARAHARLMAQHQTLAHEFPGEPDLKVRIAATGVRSSAVAENVASTTFDDVAVRLHQDLMDSRAHRGRILDPQYNAVGVGTAAVGRTVYVAQTFARVLPEVSPEAIAAAVLDGLQRLRASDKLAPLGVLDQPKLREAVCQADVSARSLLDGFAGSRSALLFTTFDGTLPDETLSSARDRRYTRVAIEVCPERTGTIGAQYRVAVLLF